MRAVLLICVGNFAVNAMSMLAFNQMYVMRVLHGESLIVVLSTSAWHTLLFVGGLAWAWQRLRRAAYQEAAAFIENLRRTDAGDPQPVVTPRVRHRRGFSARH